MPCNCSRPKEPEVRVSIEKTILVGPIPSVLGLWTYERVGLDKRAMELLAGGKIGIGAAGLEQRWSQQGETLWIEGSGISFSLNWDGHQWFGKWNVFEKCEILLVRPE